MQHFYYESLLRRLAVQGEIYATIKAKLLRTEAGIFGEIQVARELNEILASDILWIANFQTFSLQNTPIQIDFILILQDRILLLEVKNITGVVRYIPHAHEFHRINTDGEVDTFRNPFDQAFRHQQLLSQLLTHHGYNIPISYAVIMTNPHCNLDSSLHDYPIFHLSYLRRYLASLQIDNSITINQQEIKSWLLEKIQFIPPKRLTELPAIEYGILCPNCGMQMHYSHGVCICSSCYFKSRTSLFETIRDYYLLIGDRISSKSLRSFALLDSKHTSSKILRRINFQKVGKGRSTEYIIPPDFILTYADKEKWRKKDG